MLEANEDKIESVLSERTSRVYDQLVNYLSLHDIHLLISTLECLYSLSCLGESTCKSIVRTHGAVEALVSLVTVEAQSYGPKVCTISFKRYVFTRYLFLTSTDTTASFPYFRLASFRKAFTFCLTTSSKNFCAR